MSLELITGLILAVGSLITALATWAKNNGDKRKDAIDEWREIASNWKEDYEKLEAKIEDLEQRMEQRYLDHRLERDTWNKEREKIIAENKELTQRIEILEEALSNEGVDVETL